MHDSGAGAFFARVRRWLGLQAEDVPAELAACEFECRKPVCMDDHFEICERRKRVEAAIRETPAQDAPLAAAPASEPAVSPAATPAPAPAQTIAAP